MTDMKKLVETMRANEEIAAKLFDIERQMLACESSAQLFNILLSLLKEKFNLGGVFLVVNQDVFEQLFNSSITHQSSFLVENEQVYSTGEEQLKYFLDNDNVRLTNVLSDIYGLLPDEVLAQYKSIANISLSYGNQLFASLIFADESAERFYDGLGSFHLEQLAVRISLSMTNVIAREKLEFLASHDPLTGIQNRRSLEQSIHSELSRFIRYDTPFSLMFIDCDKFKAINDTYGHSCGDAVLQFVAKTLSDLTRGSDEVFRFAGDEFVVTLSNQSLRQAQQVAQRYTEHFNNTDFIYQGYKLKPSISCGVAECLKGELSDSLLKRADSNLYEVKRSLTDTRVTSKCTF